MTLVKDDLHELAVVIDARRGILLPASSITAIMETAVTVNLKDIIGKMAPPPENR